MKRFILYFGCLIFLLSTALHASAFTSDGIDYTILSEQAVSVSGPNNYTGDLVIPERVTYDGTTYIVESIWTLAFGNCWGLTSVTLPNSMITIGHSAFYGCSNLTSVTIPNSVVTIGDQAFGLCSGLASVTIGESVETIGSEAFFFCTSLASVTIPASVTIIGSDAFFFCSNLTGIEVASVNSAYCSIDGVLYNKEVSHLIQCPQTKECVNIPATVTEIESSAFSDCLNLTSVTLPETVKKIGDRAFMASGLTVATIPESVTTIGTAAYSNCSDLVSVTIGSSVTEIGNYAFYGCSALTSITLPESVTKIGTGVFSGCSRLASLEVAPENPAYCAIDGILYDKEVSFLIQCLPVKESVTIPGSVITIADNAFSTCSNLTSIIIPESVTAIGFQTFSDCSSLTSVTIPSSVTEIKEGTFLNCSGLVSITIPESVTTIRFQAFSYCSSLTSITLPESVTVIEYYSFNGCSNLRSVYCKMSNPISCNPEFPDEVLSDAVLYVPIGCKPKYETVEPWSGFAHIEEMDYSGIGHVAADCTVRIVANHGALIVEGLGNGEAVTVYDMNGRTVYRGTAQPILLQSGSYVVRAGNKTVKVVI